MQEGGAGPGFESFLCRLSGVLQFAGRGLRNAGEQSLCRLPRCQREFNQRQRNTHRIPNVKPFGSLTTQPLIPNQHLGILPIRTRSLPPCPFIGLDVGDARGIVGKVQSGRQQREIGPDRVCECELQRAETTGGGDGTGEHLVWRRKEEEEGDTMKEGPAMLLYCGVRYGNLTCGYIGPWAPE